MHENGEPASLGTIEEVPAAGLTLRHVGRQVSFTYDGERIHGRLTEVALGRDFASDLVIDGQTFRVEGGAPVRVVIQTAAEVAAERRAEVIAATAEEAQFEAELARQTEERAAEAEWDA